VDDLVRERSNWPCNVDWSWNHAEAGIAILSDDGRYHLQVGGKLVCDELVRATDRRQRVRHVAYRLQPKLTAGYTRHRRVNGGMSPCWMSTQTRSMCRERHGARASKISRFGLP
jgi:hypothetical protein